MNNIKNLYNQLLTIESTINELHIKGFKNFEEYMIYDNKIQELRINKTETIKNLFNELKNNIKQFYNTFYETGVVWTKFENDIIKGNFLIWIDNGRNVDHKFFNINELNII